MLVWSVERGMDHPEVSTYPFPKQAQLGSGYLLPVLTLSVSQCVIHHLLGTIGPLVFDGGILLLRYSLSSLPAILRAMRCVQLVL